MYSILLTVALSSGDPGYVERHVFRGNGCAGVSCQGGAGCRGAYRVRVRVRDTRHGGCAGRSGGCTGVPAATPAPAKAAAAPVMLCPCGATCDCLGCNCDTNALRLVNERRARAGLRPYVQDDGLVRAALAAATFRARNRIHGHTQNDFAFLPAGVTATAAGSGALEPSWGFATCAMTDNCTTAGAATVVGDDGLCYHQLFVR